MLLPWIQAKDSLLGSVHMFLAGSYKGNKLDHRAAASEAESVQVMPALQAQTEDSLLKELQHRWTNHRIMVRWLSKFFNYLDRCLPPPSPSRQPGGRACSAWPAHGGSCMRGSSRGSHRLMHNALSTASC